MAVIKNRRTTGGLSERKQRKCWWSNSNIKYDIKRKHTDWNIPCRKNVTFIQLDNGARTDRDGDGMVIKMTVMMMMMMWEFFISHCWLDVLCMCSAICPTMHRSVFNCSKFYPRGTIMLILRVVSAKPSDWSERHSNCADNSHQARLL